MEGQHMPLFVAMETVHLMARAPLQRAICAFGCC